MSDPESSAPRRRYAGLAIVAIITALVSLFFEGRVAPLNLAAAISAVLGLRQIRRDPLRYQGRLFCWAAIALAMVLALLAALVEPSIALVEPLIDSASP